MKLKKLIKDIPDLSVRGHSNPDILGLTSHSKEVAPGFIYVAFKGERSDGNIFVEDAIQAGANTILTDLYNPFIDKDIVQLITNDVRAAAIKLAKVFYDTPDQKLFIVGVTGTSGKTTTTYLIQHILESNGPCGLIGTIEWKIKDRSFPSPMTTPDFLKTYQLLSEMSTQGCSSVAIEVSSHALMQQRLKGIDFDVVAYTNLSLDHLDYHKTMGEYAKAKSRLFSNEYASSKARQVAVVNKDDAYHTKMLPTTRELITYSLKDRSASLYLDNLVLNQEGIRASLAYQGKIWPLFSSLWGRFNAYNILAAIGCCLAKGLSLDVILEALASFEGVPGRLEKVNNPLNLRVFVDYAHKPDGLANVLKTLQEITPGKLIVVFGCGGCRDTEKRAIMGKIAEELADLVIITTDNPRSEDPASIANQILQGISNKNEVILELDRSCAIQLAIQKATSQDVILIAGKGHETYQIFATQTLPFDDRKEALKWINELKTKELNILSS